MLSVALDFFLDNRAWMGMYLTVRAVHSTFNWSLEFNNLESFDHLFPPY